MNLSDFYKAMNAEGVEDILRHFPVRYESLLPSGNPLSPHDGERCVVLGLPFSVHAISPRNTSIIRFKIKSQTAVLSAILFNQPFYLTRLSGKKELLFVLYYSEPRKAFIVHGVHDPDSFYAMTGIRPVYSLPKSVPTSYFTNYLKKMLQSPSEASYLLSPVPRRLQEKYRLLDEKDAYRAVHFPRTEEELKNGLRVFKYEEALSYSVRSLLLKRKADRKKKRRNPPIDHRKINAIVKTIPYRLTQDQLTAIREIVLDMEKERVMYRLLQGDVGTGKTIVCLVCLYANSLRGKQGVLMAPTFELAHQHFRNALRFFKDTPVRLAFLANAASMKAKEKREIEEGLKNGEIDILIGTHAALSEKIQFHDLGLSVIDEQQLFGVEQRDSLLSKGESDLLMVTATPIPRTLSQIINADLDVSTLEQFPQGKRNVKTKVVRSTDPIIDDAIRKCLEVKRQIFVVAPKIDENDKDKANAKSIFKEMCQRYGSENCQLLHGRMKKEDQKEVYDAFLKGDKPILVSTTVVEVGIDVSRAALLIVYDANCFGLSSLHQLRGRIGRSGDFALCLLIYDGRDEESQDKLSFLAGSNDGFQISQYDLKLRGAGSYSGERQSGKSELSVCNFVSDYNIFRCAKEDAKEILESPEERENAEYLSALDRRKEMLLS